LVLSHEYIQFHEISRDKDAQGRAAYEALVYLGWDDKRKQYDLLWLDTTSGAGLTDPVIGHGKRSGNEIPFVLNGGDGSVFHTVFIYSPSDDAWQWRMDGEENGKMKPFARFTLKRK
jgi:hypothetical protein